MAKEEVLQAYVYMLRCSDGHYYVGKTQASLEARVTQHNAGSLDGYTAARRPVELVWHLAFSSYADANAVERQLKGWSRAKEEALIRGDFDAIHRLASRGAWPGERASR